jgi:hypothetical protein
MWRHRATLASGDGTWVVIDPNPAQQALISPSGPERLDFLDVTQTIEVFRPSDLGLSELDQATALLRWELPVEPLLSASIKLVDYSSGHLELGPNLVSTPPDGWRLGPGTGVEARAISLYATSGIPCPRAAFTPLSPGNDYLVAFDWRNGGLDGSQRVEAVGFDPSGHIVAISPVGSGYTCGRSGVWTRSWFALNAPTGAAEVALFLEADGSGMAEFQDVQISLMPANP